MTRQRGFTLIELMVVVAIIAILSAMLFGVSPRPYTANAQAMADQLASTFTFARTRAVATRKVHKVTIDTNTDGEQVVDTYAASLTGMAYTNSTVWQLVEEKRIPHSAILWSAETSAVTTTGATPAQGGNLPYTLYFKPDGSATPSTVYVTDRGESAKKYRVLVYHTTGSAYARAAW